MRCLGRWSSTDSARRRKRKRDEIEVEIEIERDRETRDVKDNIPDTAP